MNVKTNSVYVDCQHKECTATKKEGSCYLNPPSKKYPKGYYVCLKCEGNGRPKTVDAREYDIDIDNIEKIAKSTGVKDVPSYVLDNGVVRWIINPITNCKESGELRIEDAETGKKKILTISEKFSNTNQYVYGGKKDATYNVFNLQNIRGSKIVFTEGFKKCEQLDTYLLGTEYTAIGVKNGFINKASLDYLTDKCTQFYYAPDIDKAGFNYMFKVSKLIPIDAILTSIVDEDWDRKSFESKGSIRSYDIGDEVEELENEYDGNYNDVQDNIISRLETTDKLDSEIVKRYSNYFNLSTELRGLKKATPKTKSKIDYNLSLNIPKELDSNDITYLGEYIGMRSLNDIVEFNDQYISKAVNLRDTKHKHIFVNSRCCTGKSMTIKKQLSEEKIIVITHLQSLAKQNSDKLDCVFYQDYFRMNKNERQQVTRISICIDSLRKIYDLPNLKEYTLVIDEVDQVIMKLRQIKDFSEQTTTTLKEMVNICKRSVFMSALIPDYVYQTIANFRRDLGTLEDTIIYVNKYTRDVKFYNLNTVLDKLTTHKDMNLTDKIMAHILSTLESGEKVCIPVTTKKLCKTYALYFSKLGYKVLRIDADCETSVKQTPLETIEKYDVVIYTQTIFTGMDYNTPLFKHCYMLDYLNTSNYQELYQAVHRFRQVEHIYYYSKNGQSELKSKSFAQVKHHYNTRAKEFVNFDKLNEEQKKLYESKISRNSLYNGLFINLNYHRQQSSTSKDVMLERAMKFYGATIVDYEEVLQSFNKVLYNETNKQLLKRCRNNVDYLERKYLENSSTPTDRELRDIESSYCNNQVHDYKRIKYKTEKKFNTESDKDTMGVINMLQAGKKKMTHEDSGIEFARVDAESLKTANSVVEYLDKMFTTTFEIKDKVDLSFIDEENFKKFDGILEGKKSHRIQMELAHRVVKAMGTSFVQYRDAEFNIKINKIINEIGADKIERHCFNIPYMKDSSEIDYSLFMRNFFKLTGRLLKTVSAKQSRNGKRVRVYRLDMAHIKDLLGRYRGRKRSGAGRKKVSGNLEKQTNETISKSVKEVFGSDPCGNVLQRDSKKVHSMVE